jgi:hypothetical protein
VGVKALLTGACLTALLAGDATAQHTRFDAINGCERIGAIRFKHQDPAFRRFIIDRARIVTDRVAERAGNQFIATVYNGTATYEAAAGPKTVRFICLHGGAGRGAVFVYTLPVE